MNRREFIKSSSILGLLLLSPPSLSLTASNRVSFAYEVELPYRKDVRLWIPIPANTDYQRLTDLRFEGTYRRAGIFRDDIYRSPILYAEFPSSEKKKVLRAVVSVEFSPRRVSLREEKEIPKEVEIFLKPSEHIPTEGKVKEVAERITEGKGSILYKVWTIYNWVVENTYRDEKVKGCGPGNVNDLILMLEKGGRIGGKCADQSSLFVALCRSIGIPAREVFGIRVLPAKVLKPVSIKKGATDITKAQHCRAEFWAGEWIPVDPADVTKLMLKEKLPLNHPKVDFAKRYLFGNWDPHWVAYNWARDFVLKPEQENKPMNFLGYPYAEVDGEPLNWLEPQTFIYRIRLLKS